MTPIKLNYFTVITTIILLFSLAACQDDAPDTDNNSTQPVEFIPSVDHDWNTAARYKKDNDNISILEFEKGDSIIVDAWHIAEGFSTLPNEPNFMNTKKLILNENSSWDYTPKKYWPANEEDRLAFFAYHTAGAKYFTIDTHDPNTGYPTFKFNHSDNKEYANIVNDILATPIKAFKRSELVNGKAPLEFRHIMTKIKLKMRYRHNDDTPANGETIRLIDSRMTGFPTEGDFKGFDENDEPIWENVAISSFTVTDSTTYVITAGDDYIDIPSFTHFQYPWRTYDETENKYQTTFEFIIIINKDDQPGSAFSKKSDVDITFKAGYVTTLYVTIGAKSVEIDTTSEPISPGWSNTDNTKHNVGVTLSVPEINK